jgi:hypothetical protein
VERSVRHPIKRVYQLSVELTRGEKEETPGLPKFKPIKLSEVLRTTAGTSTRKITSDVTLELLRRVDEQQTELIKALELNPNNPDWAKAFVLLARIHHGVGVIHVDKARAPNKHAAKWTRDQDDNLLAAIDARLGKGMTATAALREIAGDEAIWNQFPQVRTSLSPKLAAARRVKTYGKRIQLIRKARLLDSVKSEIINGFTDPNSAGGD